MSRGGRGEEFLWRASGGKTATEMNTTRRGTLKMTDLFFRHIVDCEFDFAHAACAEGLGEGIVAEDSVCAAGLLGC